MKPPKVIPEQVRGYKIADTTYEYTEYQAILYALGVGLSRDPLCKEDLDFTYELSEDFKIVPTFGVTFGKFSTILETLMSCPGLPEFNPMMLLHGEHKFELMKPFTKKQKLTLKHEIKDIADKGKGALLTFMSTVYDESGSVVCRNTAKLFIRGIGGFGDKGLLNEKPVVIPKTAPSKESLCPTSPSQAIIYRLAGDFNPLHISPDMAALGGFDKPILHGLCFFGIAGRSILKDYCQDDVRKFKSISARFTSHVFPGETLIIETWQTPGGILFQQKTKERGKVCCVGMVELNQPSPKL